MPRLRDFPSTIPEHVAVHLTNAQRRCIEMYVEDGLTHRQIAGRLGVTRQAVTKHLAMGLAKITARWRPRWPSSLHGLDESRIVAAI